MRLRIPPLVLALAVVACVCAPGAGAKTLWLCGPGVAHDPCTPSLATTLVSPTGTVTGRSTPRRAARPRYDCFYAYPTVSAQTSLVASLRVDPEERSVALYQAARYSQDCRVFAPVYRQVTLNGLLHPSSVTAAMRELGYRDVLAAWRDYLAHYSHGRGFVLIGHSQGSFILRRLIAQQIDGKPSLRRRLISAVVLGGNVLVKQGSDVGGDFRNVPACRAAAQTGCVIAYSTFEGPVPDDAVFGRASVALPGQPAPPPGTEVLCTNPAALGGGSAPLTPIVPEQKFAPGTGIGILTAAVGFTVPVVPTPWVSAPGSYAAQCQDSGGANVLEVTPQGGAPALRALPDATWGLHLVDPTIAMGDLTADVRAQAAAWLGSVSR